MDIELYYISGSEIFSLFSFSLRMFIIWLNLNCFINLGNR